MAINLTDFTKIWASTSPLTPYAFSDNNYKQGWNFVGATPPARQMWDSYMKFSDEKQQYIVNNFLPLAGGTMTGHISYNMAEPRIFIVSAQNEAGRLRILGGSGINNGAQLLLSGKDNTSTAGQFQLGANDGTNSASLFGYPNGTLTWGGNTIPTKGTHIQAGKTSTTTVNANSNTTVSITFSPAFSSTPVVLATVNTGYAGVFVAVGGLSTSGATLYITNVSSTNRSVIVGWMAISI